MSDGVKNLSKAIFAGTAALALTAGTVYAQDPDSKSVVNPDDLYQSKVLDRKYQDALSRQPDSKEVHDPWGSVRASDVTNKKDDKKKPK